MSLLSRSLGILLIILMLGAVSAPVAWGAEAPVVLIHIKGDIDGAQSALVHKAMLEATTQKAQAILVEIDTFGGQVDVATVIRDYLSDAPMLTICYIKNRAWSAGALIALANKKIAIAPGGSIGAAEPIPTTEKTVAALKAEFAATANKTGRNPLVAVAMVDKSLGFPGYAKPGEILALTDYQAVAVGYADFVANTRQEVLAHYGLQDAPIQEYSMGWQEQFAGLLSNSLVKSALVALIFLAIMTEIKTAGLGVAALIGAVAAMLFFGSQWLTGQAHLLEIILLIAGAALIFFELHIPGLGIFAFGGIGCILASFFLTLGGDMAALNILGGSLAVAIIIFIIIVRRLPSSQLWARLVLKNTENSQEGFSSGINYLDYLDKDGVTLTLLRPAGIIDIGGVHLDVVSEGQYIVAGTRVKVVAVSGSRIVVRAVSE
jgi:membrane-bound serine protease (ClpP class)